MQALIMAAALAAAAPAHPAASRLGDWGPAASGDLTGVVRDSAGGQGLVGGDVIVSRDGRIIARSQTDPSGRFRIHNLPDGPTTSKCGFLVFVRSSTTSPSKRVQGDGRLRRARAVRRTTAGAGDDRPGAGGHRYPHREPGVQAEQLSRRSHADRRPRSSSSPSPEPLAHPPARSISAVSTPNTRITSMAFRCRPAFPAA